MLRCLGSIILRRLSKLKWSKSPKLFKIKFVKSLLGRLCLWVWMIRIFRLWLMLWMKNMLKMKKISSLKENPETYFTSWKRDLTRVIRWLKVMTSNLKIILQETFLASLPYFITLQERLLLKLPVMASYGSLTEIPLIILLRKRLRRNVKSMKTFCRLCQFFRIWTIMRGPN